MALRWSPDKLAELNEREADEARTLVEEANEAQRLRKWVVREKVE